MNILAIILILLLIYYLILYFFVFKGSWRSMFSIHRKRVENIIETRTAKIFDETDIMGKGGSYTGTTSIGIIEPLEIEVLIEYEPEQKVLDEETLELEEEGFSDYSSGITFEDLQKVVDAVQSDETSDETENEAGETISNLEQTDMFEILLQLSGESNRVEDLLKKHVDKMEHVSGNKLQLDLF